MLILGKNPRNQGETTGRRLKIQAQLTAAVYYNRERLEFKSYQISEVC